MKHDTHHSIRNCLTSLHALLLVACLPGAVLGQLGAQTYSLSNVWNVPTNAASTHIVTGDNNRGLAYSAVSNQVFVPHRNVPAIDVFDGASGSFVGGVDVSWTAGGNFKIDQVAVADDGVIYACNLQTAPTVAALFKIYRWAAWNDTNQIASFAGDPTYAFPPSGLRRVGDSMAVSGSGTNTIILTSLVNSGGSPWTTNFVLFSTTDGTNFTSTVVAVSGLPTPASGPFVGLAFYTNNTFLMKPPTTGANQIYLVQFPANFAGQQNVAGTVLATNSLANSTGPTAISFNSNAKLLATAPMAGVPTTPINLFTVPLFGTITLVANTNYPTPNGNGNATGGIALGGQARTNNIFTLDTNNGLQNSQINFTPAAVAPAITGQPAGGTVYTNDPAFTFSVTASGSVPFSYQWQFSSTGNSGTFTNVSGATASSYALNFPPVSAGGYYAVVVTNIAGAATSSPAHLIVLTPLTSTNVSILWRAAVGSQPFLLSSDYGTRGIAYSALSNVVLVASHSASSNGIYLMDGSNGALIGALNAAGLDPSPTFGLDQVGVADDGIVYACSLSVAGQKLDIYSWASADPSAIPGQAYGPDGPDNPGNGSISRWGDTMAVRGLGTGTQIIMGTPSANQVIVFTTSDGVTFTPHVITVSDSPNGFAGLGVAFGSGDTFWAKNAAVTPGGDLRLCSFDTGSGTGSTLLQYTAGTQVPTSMTGIGVDVTNNILAATVFGDTPHDLQLLQLSGNANPPALFDQAFYPSFNANIQFNAAVTIGGGRAYSVDANNGIIALSYSTPLLPPSPTITSITHSGSSTTVTWTTFNGRSYQLQSRDALLTGPWSNVGSPIVGSAATASATDTSATPATRLYRVIAY